MRPSRSIGQLATIALSLSPLASALSWPRWLPAADSLVVREDATATAAAASTGTASPKSTEAATGKHTTKATVTDAPTTTAKTSTKGMSVITTNLNTGGLATGNSTATGNGTTHTIFPANDPAGSVVMLTPNPTQVGTNLYKIGDYVTWGWNYTNLQGTPTAVDVLVSCSTVTATWTLTQNMTFETLGAFTWDTSEYQATGIAQPLLTEMYTLVIIDADSSVTATAEAGYLAPFTGFKFGLYTPQPYSGIGEWECATCSAALGAVERRAVGAAVAMSVVTVLSFTWFAAGFAGMV